MMRLNKFWKIFAQNFYIFRRFCGHCYLFMGLVDYWLKKPKAHWQWLQNPLEVFPVSKGFIALFMGFELFNQDILVKTIH